jgi:hypothetical protein
MRRATWSRIAAATGIDFVAAIVAAAIIFEVKDLQFAGDAAKASNEVFGSIAMLWGVGAASLFWFTGTLAARIRQLEGGSGRLAAMVNTSGSFIAGLIALSAGILFAARNSGSTELANLVTAILDGPTWVFPAAVYVTATGVVGIRTPGLPVYSRVVARLSVPLGAAFIAGAGLQIFKNYAWINDTAYISFLAWVLILSIIGIMRWGEMDEEAGRPARARAAAAESTPIVATRVRRARPARKTTARKSTARRRAAPRSAPPIGSEET